MVRRILLALVAAVLLAGCQDDPAVKRADPTPSPSATSTSASPTESASAEPETAEAFIRRWSDASVAMQNTGNTSRYRSLTSGCKTCAKFADIVEKYYGADGYIRLPGQRITAIEEQLTGTERSVYDVSIDPEPTEYLERAGGEPKNLRGDPIVLRVTLLRSDSTWLFVDYEQLAT